MNYDGKKWGLEDYRNIPQYNWQDEIFRSAWMQSHNVSLTGGSEGVRYNASLSYYCLLYTSSLPTEMKFSIAWRVSQTNGTILTGSKR